MSALFRIIVLHAGPKSSHRSTETYLVAESEDAVCAWIDKNKKYGLWFLEDEDAGPNMRYADDSCKVEIPFREWVMKNRGDLTDDEGWDDAYYGIKKWGWEPIPAAQDEIAVLIKLGIAIEA